MTLSEERLREIVARYYDASEPFAEEIGLMARELLSLRSDAHTNGEVHQCTPEELAETYGGEINERFRIPAEWQATVKLIVAHAIEHDRRPGHPIQGEAVGTEPSDLGRSAISLESWKVLTGGGPGWFSGYHYAEGPGDLRIRTNDRRLLDRILSTFASPQPPTPAWVREITDEEVERVAIAIAKGRMKQGIPDHLFEAGKFDEVFMARWNGTDALDLRQVESYRDDARAALAAAKGAGE